MQSTKSQTPPAEINAASSNQDPVERRRRIASVAYSLAARRDFAGDSEEAFEDWSEAVRIVDQSKDTGSGDAKPASKVLTRAMRQVSQGS